MPNKLVADTVGSSTVLATSVYQVPVALQNEFSGMNEKIRTCPLD